VATFGELQVKASTRLKDPQNQAVSATDVAAIINDAITHWNKRRFWFNEFEEIVTLTQNNPVLPALTVTPEYIFKEGGIVVDYAQTRWPLEKISSAEYDSINVQGRGIPYAWTFRNNNYELYWYPDANYSAVIRGVKQYPALSGTNDTNDFTTDASDLILYETLARLFGEFRQDTKMEGYYLARTNNEYQTLKRRTRRNNSTGRIHVKGI